LAISRFDLAQPFLKLLSPEPAQSPAPESSPFDKGLYGGRATSPGGIAPYSSYNEATVEVNMKF